MAREPKVVIIGAGMSGIAIAVTLKKAGFHDFTVLEKGSRVGGVWHWNTYPGLTCDVPSLLYRYTFAGKPDWSHFFAKGPDIQRYHEDVAREHDVTGHIRLNTEVTGARFENERWHVETAGGDRFEADFLVAATGILHHPRVPDIPGMADFDGPLFHTARWDHRVDPRGKRVAVIGTGSTGVQLTTALQPIAKQFSLFQRTAQWVIPAPTRLPQPAALTALLRQAPWLNQAIFDASLRASRVLTDITLAPGPARTLAQAYARASLRLIRDRRLRAKLTPDYEPFCKRQVVSGEFHRAVQRKNVSVVTEEIERIVPEGIRTADGTVHEFDVIALATGFQAHNYMRPMRLTGRDGTTIDEAWENGTFAYRMTAIPGFPNFFTVLGPNSPIGSVHLQYTAEHTGRYIVSFLRRFRRGELTTAEVTETATKEFNEQVRTAIGPTVWNTGCQSWYLDDSGTVDLWPFDRKTLTRMLREPDPEHYTVTV
ncbi:flavin-containing monooxygenase [Sciscionella sediminilitoris]|uniref:flavin-containing monooxygenase n=1 Tax=Sciscionella sediminilitoris TaxID=1445613 RepID=UPI0004DEF99B|nr:NAD(P)/FAD-dependent oxidoreductase [Sciscionella sp. SE31]